MTDMQKISKQLAEMLQVLKNVQARIGELQKGHDDVLFGKIDGMNYQLQQVSSINDKTTKQQILTNIITVLNEARNTVERELLRRLDEIPDTPRSPFGIIRKQITDSGFYTTTMELYDRIELLFQYYVNSTYIMGQAFLELGEPMAFRQVFTPSPDLIENKNFIKLMHAEKLFKTNIGDTWYKNPDHYLLLIRDASESIFSDNT